MKALFSKKNQQQIHLTSILFAVFVVGLGAYTRLKHAGLGCPDWPKCFENWIVHPNITMPALTQEASQKAWIEMIHRYAAGILCCKIVVLNGLAIYQKQNKGTLLLQSTALVTCFQALFGMWTVTWRLHPLAVMPHLIGGLTITTLLTLSYHQRYTQKSETPIPSILKKTLLSLLCVLLIQIILGGWTSANYAALSCPDFPTCQGKWMTSMQGFIQGFSLPFGFDNYEGGVLSGEGRIGIHIAHRLGAMVCSLLIIIITQITIVRRKDLPPRFLKMIAGLISLFLLQITLGILNVIWILPMTIAVGHNLIAVALFIHTATTYLLFEHKTETIEHLEPTWQYS